MVTRIRIDVFSHDGKVLLGESHSIKFGAEGLLDVPVRLGISASSMLCFPTKDEAKDESNRGDPFTSICAIFLPYQSAQILSTLVNCGYSTSEGGSVAQLWVRTDPSHIKSLGTSNVDQTRFPPDQPSKVSRAHLPSDIKARLKSACNDVCPRDKNGIMLAARAQGGVKRPAWCISEIMGILGDEFGESNVKDAREKALNYMSRSAIKLKRLQSISEEAWEKMPEEERLAKEDLLKNFQMSAEQWRLARALWVFVGRRKD
jgi:hypothetical protein